MDVGEFGDGGLHAEGEFVVGDGGFELAKEGELAFLDPGVGFEGLDVGHSVAGGSEHGALEGGGQEAAAEVLEAAGRMSPPLSTTNPARSWLSLPSP